MSTSFDEEVRADLKRQVKRWAYGAALSTALLALDVAALILATVYEVRPPNVGYLILGFFVALWAVARCFGRHADTLGALDVRRPADREEAP